MPTTLIIAHLTPPINKAASLLWCYDRLTPAAAAVLAIQLITSTHSRRVEKGGIYKCFTFIPSIHYEFNSTTLMIAHLPPPTNEAASLLWCYDRLTLAAAAVLAIQLITSTHSRRVEKGGIYKCFTFIPSIHYGFNCKVNSVQEAFVKCFQFTYQNLKSCKSHEKNKQRTSDPTLSVFKPINLVF